MKSKKLSLSLIKRRSLPILKRNGVIKAGLFGSYARGENKRKSDIDILIKFKGRKSLLDLVKLKHELEDAFGRDFDVITYNSIHPKLKKDILNDEVKVL